VVQVYRERPVSQSISPSLLRFSIALLKNLPNKFECDADFATVVEGQGEIPYRLVMAMVAASAGWSTVLPAFQQR
jgi:hypothetical protein